MLGSTSKSVILRVILFMPRAPKAVKGVYEREPGVWCGRYRTREGKLVRKTFGSDRLAAVAWVEEARTTRRNPNANLPTSAKVVPVLPPPEPEPTPVTVANLCKAFAAYVKANPREYRDQENPPKRIKRIQDHFGDRPAASIKASEIEGWLGSLVTKGRHIPKKKLAEPDAPTISRVERTKTRARKKPERLIAEYVPKPLAEATVNKLRGTFSMLYRYGKRMNLIDDMNPAVNVPLKKLGPVNERYLSYEEEDRLRSVLQADIDAHAGHEELRKQAVQRLLELDVSLKSGMRRGEQYNLRWPDVNFESRTMRLRETKNGKPRNAFMIDDVYDAMRTLQSLGASRRDRDMDKDDALAEDSVFSKAENKRWWKPALKKAGITKYRWHDNRHTFCSRLVQKGVHLKKVQEAAGHASIASTVRYAHFAESEVLEAMAVLNSPRA